MVRDDFAEGTISLGVVGNHNRPIQNEDRAELLMRILEVDHLELLDSGCMGTGTMSSSSA